MKFEIYIRGMWSNTTGAFNMLWKWDISITIIWLRSRRLQMFSKHSGLKVVQINCIRMEIVFLCTPAGFAGKNKLSLGSKFVLLWENVILCSLQYISTDPMNPFVHKIFVSAILHNVLCGFGHVKDCLKSSIGL